MSKAITLILLGILILLLSPLLAIWGLNTISEQSQFGWQVPHNVWTYLAVYALAAVFKGASSK